MSCMFVRISLCGYGVCTPDHGSDHTITHPIINRYWDDGMAAKTNKRRFYAVRRNTTPQMSHKHFAKFLVKLSPDQLNIASKIVRVSSELDLNDTDRDFLGILRENYDLLLMSEDCSYAVVRERLIALHKFGILNLSLNPLVNCNTLPQRFL